MKDQFPQLLQREEWDFSAVPADEAEACVRYELAREILNWERYFSPVFFKSELELEDSALRRPTSGLLTKGQRLFPNIYFPVGKTFWCTVMPEYFPDVPWQDIPLHKREYIGMMYSKVRPSFEGWSEEICKTVLGEDRAPFFEISGHGFQAVPVEIDWKQSDSNITEDFKVWLRNNRPSSVQITSEVGRQSVRDDLNAISALRLRHHFLANDASRLTENFLGKPLYANKSSWDRAAKRAVQLFREHFTDASGPKSSLRKTAPRGRPRVNPKRS